MNIAIIGGRDFTDYELVKETIKLFETEEGILIKDFTHIVSGGAKGADSLAKKFANEFGIPLIEHFPNWEKYKKAAGYIRNELIINDSDVVFAFWDGKSKGTKNSIDIARAKKKTLIITKYLKS